MIKNERASGRVLFVFGKSRSRAIESSCYLHLQPFWVAELLQRCCNETLSAHFGTLFGVFDTLLSVLITIF